ncbi:MAG: hypothetical protein AB1595_04290 [bacterium]
MIVVADATCLIALCRIERLDILRKLFGKVNIGETVFKDMMERLRKAGFRIKDGLYDKILKEIEV